MLGRFAGPGHPGGLGAVVRRENLVVAGVSSAEAWAAVVRLVAPPSLPITPVPAGQERFVRGGRTILIDHDRLTVEGLGVAALEVVPTR